MEYKWEENWTAWKEFQESATLRELMEAASTLLARVSGKGEAKGSRGDPWSKEDPWSKGAGKGAGSSW